MVMRSPLNLKAELASRRLTQRKVAREMGITHTYLSKLVNRAVPWTRPMALAFASVTGIALDSFYEEAAV